MQMIIRNQEEFVLLPKWLRDVVCHHCIDSCSPYRGGPRQNPIYIDVRTRVQGLETDLIVTCRSGSRNVRIGFELKETDIYKAIHQALVRRPLFHYFYIVLNMHVYNILTVLKGCRYTRDALEHGIGFISSEDGCVVIKSYSRGNWMESRAYVYTLLQYIQGREERGEENE